MREKIAVFLAFFLASVVLWASAFGFPDAMLFRSFFLMVAIWLTILLYPLGKGKKWRPLGIVIDILFSAMAATACFYIHYNYETIMMNLPEAEIWDIYLTVGMLVVILDLARRTVGFIFPVLVISGLLYAMFGNMISGPLGHKGFDIYFLTETIFLGDLGMWGLLLGVAATTIAAFVLFGAILLHTGGGNTFMDMSLFIAGKSPGGAAKIATIASGLFGMVSGSAVANVATTGNFTIPMMRRLNYPPALAGAVEAVASTGGQIAPPIMGAGAFIMAELVGIDYWKIALAALLPAFIYYFTIYFTIHYYAKHHRLGVVPDDQIPTAKQLWDPPRLLPLVGGLIGISVGVFLGRSIQSVAFYGILGMAVPFLGVMLYSKQYKKALADLKAGMIDAGRGMVIISILLAGAQILVAIINLTGLGVSLSSIIASMAQSHIFILAPIVACVCLILGMGLPTTAAYVLVGCVMAPAMTRLGIEPLIAHMFIFYYATISVITPPVCTAVFVASGIAQAPWLSVARYAVMLAVVTYILPILFLVYPGLLWQGSYLDIAEALVSSLAFSLACVSIFGHRVLTGVRAFDVCIFMGVAALGLMTSWLAAFAAWALLISSFWLESKKEKAVLTPPVARENSPTLNQNN